MDDEIQNIDLDFLLENGISIHLHKTTREPYFKKGSCILTKSKLYPSLYLVMKREDNLYTAIDARSGPLNMMLNVLIEKET